MVVPRLERRAAAGLVTTTADRDGMTPTEESLFRGAARTALDTGVPVSIRFGADALHDLDIVLDEKLPADRVLVGGAGPHGTPAGAALEVARRGAYVGPGPRGHRTTTPIYLNDNERAALVLDLVAAGFAEQIILSANAIGVAKGQPDYDLPFSHVLTTFVPLLQSLGLTDADATAHPRRQPARAAHGALSTRSAAARTHKVFLHF